MRALSVKLAIPLVDLTTTEINESVLKMVPLTMVRRFNVMPISKKGNTLSLAISDPARVSDTKGDQAPHRMRDTAVPHQRDPDRGGHRPLLRGPPYGRHGQVHGPTSAWAWRTPWRCSRRKRKTTWLRLESDSKQPPVVRIVNHCFIEAIRAGASDIHIEPYEDVLRVRFRIDGVLFEILKVPIKFKDGVISRVKVLSKMDIAEKRIPQDGRIKLQVKVDDRMRNLDVRVSTTPTLFGEKIVMRLLDKEGLMLDMSLLGFEPRASRGSKRRSSGPGAWCSSRGPPARARQTPSTAPSAASIPPYRTS